MPLRRLPGKPSAACWLLNDGVQRHMVSEYRSEGSFAQWLRQTVAEAPELLVEELVAMAALRPRSWRMRQTASAAMVRAALKRLVHSGEVEVAEGRVSPTRQI